MGAQRGDVLGTVLRQALSQIAAGVTLGWIASWIFTRLLRSLLFEVPGTDWAITVAVAILLASVGLAASPRFRYSR